MSICISVSFVVKTAGHVFVKFIIVVYTKSYLTKLVMIDINKIKTHYAGTQILHYITSYLLSVAHISYQVTWQVVNADLDRMWNEVIIVLF